MVGQCQAATSSGLAPFSAFSPPIFPDHPVRWRDDHGVHAVVGWRVTRPRLAYYSTLFGWGGPMPATGSGVSWLWPAVTVPDTGSSWRCRWGRLSASADRAQAADQAAIGSCRWRGSQQDLELVGRREGFGDGSRPQVFQPGNFPGSIAKGYGFESSPCNILIPRLCRQSHESFRIPTGGKAKTIRFKTKGIDIDTAKTRVP